jgi:hypothetical protein
MSSGGRSRGFHMTGSCFSIGKRDSIVLKSVACASMISGIDDYCVAIDLGGFVDIQPPRVLQLLTDLIAKLLWSAISKK